MADDDNNPAENLEAAEQEAAESPAQDSASSAEKGRAAKPRGLWDFKPEDFDDKRFGKLRFKVANRRRTVFGIGAVGGIGSLFFAFSVAQGPFEAIHYAQILQQFHGGENEEFMDGRTSRFMRGIRTYLATGAIGAGTAQSRLGRIGNRYANRWEDRLNRESGLRSVFDETTGNFQGYEIVDDKRATRFLAEQNFKSGTDANTLDRPPTTGVSFDGDNNLIRGSGRFIDLRDLSYRKRRVFTRVVTKGTHTRKITGALASRTLIKRYGIDFHPLKNLRRKATQNLVDWHRDRKSDKSDELKEGIDTGDKGRLAGQDNTDQDGNTRNTDGPASDGNDVIDQSKATKGKGPNAKKSLVSRLTRGGLLVALGQALCVINDFDSQIEDYQFEAVVKAATRMGGNRITVGNQIMSNVDTTVDEVSVEKDLLYDDEDQLSYVFNKPWQAMFGQPQTGVDTPDDNRLGDADQTPWLFDIVGRLPFLDQVCGLQDVASNIPLLGDALELTDSVVQGAIDTALSATTGATMDEFLMGVVKFFADDAVDVLAEGPYRAVIEDPGARWMFNDAAAAFGSGELSNPEAVELAQEVKESIRIDQQNKTYFARLLDVKDANSVVAGIMRETPDSPVQAIAAMFKAPTKFFSSLFAPASAFEAGAYDYGFSKFGFSAAEQNDDRFENPFENARIVEHEIGLAELNAEWGDKCFGMQIDPETGGMIFGEGLNLEKVPDECRTDDNNDGIEDNTELLRYRFYIADTIAEHTLACYEGEQTSCDQITYGSQQNAGFGQTGGVGISPDGFVFPLRTHKSTIQNHNPNWCYDNVSNCHHDYNAADIFAGTGTNVLAARGGTVVRAADNDGSAVGSRVTIKGDDGNLYYYAHMGDGTIAVAEGDTVAAGDLLGHVGTTEDAVGTDSHLHFDVLPESFTARPSCSGAACTQYPFINPQPALIAAFNELP